MSKYSPATGVNPSNIVPQWPITVCDISGSAGKLEAFWLAVRTPSTVSNYWLEGTIELYIDGVARPSWIGTGGEDSFDGAWYAIPVGGFPAGQAGKNFQDTQHFAYYKFWLNEAIQWNNELKVVYNPGQRGKGTTTSDSTIGVSAFTGVWLRTPPTPSYRQIQGLTPLTTLTGYAYGDEFTGASGTVVSGYDPAGGTNPNGAPGNWNKALGNPFILNGSGYAVSTLPTTPTSSNNVIDSRALFQVPSGFGTNYWAEGRVMFSEAVSSGVAGTNGVGTAGITSSGVTLPIGTSTYTDLGSPPIPTSGTTAYTATSGANTAVLSAVSGINGNYDWILFNDANPELAQVKNISGTTVTFAQTIASFSGNSAFFNFSGNLQYTHASGTAMVVHPWIIQVGPMPGIFGNEEKMIVTQVGVSGAGPWSVIRGAFPDDTINKGAAYNPFTHSSGEMITMALWPGQATVYPVVGIDVRSTSADGAGNQSAINIKRLSNYNITAFGTDGFSNVLGNSLINRGINFNNQFIDVAVLASGSKITYYYKFPEETFNQWQPLASCTPSVGVSGNAYVGIYGTGAQKVTVDYFRIRALA